MKQETIIVTKRQRWYVLIASSLIVLLIGGTSYWAFYLAMRAETNVRYAGLQSVVSTQLTKTIHGMEMSATNVFNEIEKHMDSPESVVQALESEAVLNPDVRGYFAAFEPNFFPQKGRWYEPYVHHTDSSSFQMSQVGSARHDYTQSAWYIRAKDIKMSFWSDPYYYYDGTAISGHYCTYVKPVFTEDGSLACVCGADITFEWLTKALQRIDDWCGNNENINKYHLMRDFQFFSVVFDREGSCIVHPDGKQFSITDPDVLQNLQLQRAGMIEMDVAGVPSFVYYGPIDGIDWTVAVVAPKSDVMKPFSYVRWFIVGIALLGIVVLWLINKPVEYAQKG